MKRLRTITSYTGLARWNIELSARPIAYLARVQVEDIRSPYAYSPSVAIWDWRGRPVIFFETSHRRYEVFEVPATMLRFKTDDEATDWHIRYSRPVAAA
ncbi:MAG: hypothetical protein Q8P46_00290 [Hyphomicrobiales bacterium]|nr:hypothetical protein [Hyphomicrobiales bacterium]